MSLVSGFVVVLDTNVLVGIRPTDLLMSMAVRGRFRPHWSPMIETELNRTLVDKRGITSAQAARRIAQMNRALPGASVLVTEALIPVMPVNPNDQHVLALAVQIGADAIVTNNLKDFPSDALDPFELEAIGLDDFVLHQIELGRAEALAAVHQMCARLRNPPLDVDDILRQLAVELPESTELLRLLNRQNPSTAQT